MNGNFGGSYTIQMINQAYLVLRNIITPYHISRPELWGRGVNYISGRVVVCVDDDFTYVRIPKCANSTIMYTLAYYTSLVEDFEKGVTHVKKVKDDATCIRDLSFKDLNHIKNDYYIFAFIRNPYDRILSAYIDKMTRKGYQTRFGSEIKKYGGGGLSFKNFCRWLQDGGVWRDAHWIPQSWYLQTFPRESYDCLEKISSLDTTISKIISDIKDITNAELIDPYFLDQSYEHKTNASDKKDMYYDKETRCIVNEVYRSDFEVYRNI